MGNRASRDTTKSNTTHNITPSNLKLASQRITEFSGKVDEWQKWKNHTSCAFVGSGYNTVLNNWYGSYNNYAMNQVVFVHLSIATSGGTAYHLVKNHQTSKDGYATWQSLLKWYNKDSLKSKTADTLRSKLESYCFSCSMLIDDAIMT
eukprot:3883445-Ditylum_brightwellii.AAC.1